MTNENTTTIEISYGSVVVTRAWSSVIGKINNLFALLPRAVTSDIIDLIEGILSNTHLLDEEEVSLDIMRSTEKKSGPIVGSLLLTLMQGKTNVERKISASVKTLILNYVSDRKEIFAEVLGVTPASLVETLTAVLADVSIKESEATPEMLYKAVMDSLSKNRHKLVPLTFVEWSRLSKTGVTSNIGNILGTNVIGDPIAKKMIKTMGLKTPKKYFKEKDVVSRETLIILNVKTNKEGQVSKFGKMPFGVSLIESLEKKRSVFNKLFGWVLTSKKSEMDTDISFEDLFGSETIDPMAV